MRFQYAWMLLGEFLFWNHAAGATLSGPSTWDYIFGRNSVQLYIALDWHKFYLYSNRVPKKRIQIVWAVVFTYKFEGSNSNGTSSIYPSPNNAIMQPRAAIG